MQEPTGPIRTEAASAGSYDSPWGTKHPRLQVDTVAGLLAGRKLDLPPSRDFRTFKKAPGRRHSVRNRSDALLRRGCRPGRRKLAHQVRPMSGEDFMRGFPDRGAIGHLLRESVPLPEMLSGPARCTS